MIWDAIRQLEHHYQEIDTMIDSIELAIRGLTADDLSFNAQNNSAAASAEHYVTPREQLSPNQKRVLWSTIEHQYFVTALRLFGRKRAQEIAREVGTRSSTQVHSHTQKYFVKLRAMTDKIQSRIARMQIKPIEFLPDFDATEPISSASVGRIKTGNFARTIGLREINYCPPLELLCHAVCDLRALGLLDCCASMHKSANYPLVMIEALNGVMTAQASQYSVRIMFGAPANYDSPNSDEKRMIIYYDASQILNVLEVAAYAITRRAGLSATRLAEIQLTFYDCCYQLYDSVRYNVEYIAQKFGIEINVVSCLLFALYTSNSFVRETQ